MKIKEKKRRPDPIIKEIFQPVAVPSIGSAVARLRAEFSLSESMRLEMDSIEAICEHLERLLSDGRLLKHSRNHQTIKKFYSELMDQTAGEIEVLLASEKAKEIAKKGGDGKAKKAKVQADAVKAYYLEHKNEFKTKLDAAWAIEGKVIYGIRIKLKASTIYTKHLTGL